MQPTTRRCATPRPATGNRKHEFSHNTFRRCIGGRDARKPNASRTRTDNAGHAAHSTEFNANELQRHDIDGYGSDTLDQHRCRYNEQHDRYNERHNDEYHANQRQYVDYNDYERRHAHERHFAANNYGQHYEPYAVLEHQ
jgi:hypothetical protein